MKTVLFIAAAVFTALFLPAIAFAQEEKEPPASDTLSLKDKCVIFWEPDFFQFDSSITSTESNLEKLSDFRRYTEQIIPFLKKKNTKYVVTARKVLRLEMNEGQNFFFSKDSLKDIVGIVLTSGIKEPIVLEGVTTDSDFFLKFRNYFERK